MTDALLSFEVSRRLFFSLIVAFVLHAVIVIALPREAHRAVLAIAQPLDVDLAAEQEPKKEEVVREERPSETHVAPPPPNRAPRVIVRSDSPPTGDAIPSADNDDSNGGKVSSSSEIDGPPVVGPVTSIPIPPPPSTTAPPPPPSIDRSRPAALAGNTEWSCPWPDEAEDIDTAIVVVTITVDPSGRAQKVDVVDPGHGFGREARRCAMQRTYVPALDRDGRPITATTKPIRVRFSR